MNCDCLDEILKKEANEIMKTEPDIIIHWDETVCSYFTNLDVNTRTFSHLRITKYDGQIEEKVYLHEFCPFCGKPETPVSIEDQFRRDEEVK